MWTKVKLFIPNLLIYRPASPKVHPVHQRHKDEKLMFGGVIETKKEKKKREKKEKEQDKEPQTEEKTNTEKTTLSSEDRWLANLNSKDVKVYRKTPSGRYKEVNKTKLFEKFEAMGAEKKIVMPVTVLNSIKTVPMIKDEPLFDSGKSILDTAIGNYPSVTKVLSQTMSEQSKAALARWKARLISELGEEGFALYNNEQLSFGTRFHSCVHRFLKTGKAEPEPDLESVWGSVSRVLPRISKVEMLEAGVHHSKLMYKGVIDCVASYMGTPSVIEWKVSQKSKPYLSATYDAPIQLSAYMGALSYDVNYNKDIRNGLVVIAYKDGAPADVFPMNEEACIKHWELWLKRLERFWTMFPATKQGRVYLNVNK